MELTRIYSPVNSDLDKVESALKEVAVVDLPWLSQLLSHSLGAGGKRVRPALTLLSGKFFHYRFEYLLPMALSIELMHTATLIHDDAIDRSGVRRGRATIYKLWGVKPAVLLGDYLFARAGVAVSDTHSIQAIRLFSETLMTISRGELFQAMNAFNLNQTREMYIQRIFGKTASLICLSTESGGILSEAPETAIKSLKAYGRNLGLAFQIVDDILDFVVTEEELGKPAGSQLIHRGRVL